MATVVANRITSASRITNANRITSASSVPVSGLYLTWANVNSELVRAATENGHLADMNGMSNYIFHDAAAFNLADGAAYNAAISAETLAISDMDTYAAAYTP